MAYIRKHLKEGLKVLGNTYSIKRIDFLKFLIVEMGTVYLYGYINLI